MVMAAVVICVAAVSEAPAQTSAAEDRVTASVNGSTLTGTDGGAGGALGWLHNFDAGTLAGLAVEHQELAGSQWSFGSVNGSTAFGPDAVRFSVYAEAHEGAGDDGGKTFHYKIEAAGATGTYDHKLTLLVENKRVDVETTHGNLPKLGGSYLVNPHVLATLSYQYSVSGNLGTRITAARIDSYWATANVFGGTAFGQASPAILNIETNILNGQSRILSPAREIHEEYVGVSKPFPQWRSEFTLVGDYIALSGINRATITLAYIYHIGPHRP
jgi:hypothetical protein